MSNKAISKAQSEASQTFGALWSVLWRSMVFFPYALIRCAFFMAVACTFVWLCTLAITYAMMHEWLLSAVCLLGILTFVAAAYSIRRHALQHPQTPTGGGDFLL